jgi:hypothetical protein
LSEEFTSLVEGYMGKKNTKPKKKCCHKYKKKSTFCKRCPVKIRLQCQLKRRNEMSKKKDKKKAEKKCSKKKCKKGKKK